MGATHISQPRRHGLRRELTIGSHVCRRLRGADGQRGAAAVELVLVAFPLIALLFGIVEFSRVFSLQLRMQQAAREGAREIALHYDDPGWTLADANAVIDGLVGAGINRAIVGCGSPADDTTVTLTTQITLAIPRWGGGAYDPVDVAARARMPCEG